MVQGRKKEKRQRKDRPEEKNRDNVCVDEGIDPCLSAVDDKSKTSLDRTRARENQDFAKTHQPERTSLPNKSTGENPGSDAQMEIKLLTSSPTWIRAGRGWDINAAPKTVKGGKKVDQQGMFGEGVSLF